MCPQAHSTTLHLGSQLSSCARVISAGSMAPMKARTKAMKAGQAMKAMKKAIAKKANHKKRMKATKARKKVTSKLISFTCCSMCNRIEEQLKQTRTGQFYINETYCNKCGGVLEIRSSVFLDWVEVFQISVWQISQSHAFHSKQRLPSCCNQKMH